MPVLKLQELFTKRSQFHHILIFKCKRKPARICKNCMVNVRIDPFLTKIWFIWSRLQHSERARQGAEERSHKLQQELGGRSSALQQQLSQLHEQW